MASRGDIKAGAAFVELTLKNAAFVKGLEKASARLRAFGGGAMKIGSAISATGLAAIVPLAAAVKHFSDFGSTLADTSARTGVAGSKLAEFGYAADQTGSNLEGVEAGLRKMAKVIGDAESGSKSANETLADLGLTLAELKGLSPDKQFELIAEKIDEVVDPTQRAAIAMRAFGKSGTALLPMIEQLKELRQEARDQGLVPTDEAIAAADAVGDAFGKITKTVGAAIFEIGGALAPAVLKAAEVINTIVVAANRWVRENSGLVQTVAAVAGGLVAGGAAITAFGVAVSAAGFLLGGLATAIGAIGTVAGVILSPIGLVGAAIVAAGAAWVSFSDSGQAAAGSIMSALDNLAEAARLTFGGIVDALKSGEFALAGQIAMTGLELAFYTSLAAINEATGGAVDTLVDTFSSALSTITFAVENWRRLVEFGFQSALVSVVTFGNEVAHFFGTVIPAYLSWFNTHWKEVFEDIGSLTMSVLGNMWENFSNLWQAIKSLFSGGDFVFNFTPLTVGFESAMKELPQIAERELGPLESHMKRRLEEMAGELTQGWEGHNANYAKSYKPSDVPGKAVGAAADLAGLRQKAAEAAAAVQKQEQKRKNTVAGAAAGSDDVAVRKDVAVSFNAAALQAQSAPITLMDKLAKAAEKTNEKLDDQLEELASINRDIVANGRLI